MSLVSRCSKPSSSLLFTVHFIPTYSTALSIQFSFENSGFGRSVLVHLKKQPEEADIFIVLGRRNCKISARKFHDVASIFSGRNFKAALFHHNCASCRSLPLEWSLIILRPLRPGGKKEFCKEWVKNASKNWLVELIFFTKCASKW